jgi:hypothetical protein
MIAIARLRDASLVGAMALLVVAVPPVVYGALAYWKFRVLKVSWYAPYEELLAAVRTGNPVEIGRAPLIAINMTSGEMLANMFTLSVWQFTISVVLGVLIGLIGLLLVGIGLVWPAIRNQPELVTEAGQLPESFGIFMLVVGLVLLLWGLADVVAGIFVMQRRQGARIAGIVTGMLGGLVGLPFIVPTDAGVNVAGLIVALPLAGGHLYAMWVLIRAGQWFAPERQLGG